jgi:hypothetical protein
MDQEMKAERTGFNRPSHGRDLEQTKIPVEILAAREETVMHGHRLLGIEIAIGAVVDRVNCSGTSLYARL